jgi:hypothetical protein
MFCKATCDEYGLNDVRFGDLVAIENADARAREDL